MNRIPLQVDPNLNNVITTEQIAVIPIYAKYDTLAKMFDMTAHTVRTIAKDMKNSAYSSYVLELGHRTVIVNVQGFMAYLTQSKTKYHYLKHYTYADKEALTKLFNLSDKQMNELLKDIRDEEVEFIIFKQVFDIELYHIRNFESYLMDRYNRKPKFEFFK